MVEANVLSGAVDDWHKALYRNPAARAWLQNRGLTDLTLGKHRIGFVETDDPQFFRFKGCVSIPYFNGPRDKVVGVAFRRPDGQMPKYDRLKGVAATLYNVTATEEAHVYVTEGEFDAMVLTQMGLAAVGVPGVTHFKPAWRFLFRDCERVTLVFDGDEAGQKGAMRVAGMLRDVAPQLEVVTMPVGRDISDLYLSDPSGLAELVGMEV